jgi:hypothetical protein
MEAASIVASIVSCIMALVAIAMSVYFYTQSKNTETVVKASLEGIRTQTDALQKLTGRWMDRLTRYVTTPQEPTIETQHQLLIAIKDLPRDIASKLPVPSQASAQQDLLRESVACYCALYYYTAVANWWAQSCLPPIQDFDRNPEYSQFVKKAVDESYRDFSIMAQTLDKVDRSLLASVPLKNLADKARDEYKAFVRDSTGVYAWRAERDASN